MIRNSESFVLKDKNKINEFIFQIRKFLSLGAIKFIFGYINENKKIDISLCKRLINEVKKVDNTWYCFHMTIWSSKLWWPFKTSIALGFKRVLTRDGKHSAIKNIDNLKRLSDLYEDKIEIIVGGKVNFNNYKWIHDENKIKKFHGRKIIDV